MENPKSQATKWKQYLGILLSSVFAIIIRIIVEYNAIEINSISFLLITPVVVSYIPFLVDSQTFLNSISKTIFFPLISIVVFIGIIVASHPEDLLYLIIVGSPFIVISAIMSLMIRGLMTKWNEKNQDDGNTSE